jgi:hypothetical protein
VLLAAAPLLPGARADLRRSRWGWEVDDVPGQQIWYDAWLQSSQGAGVQIARTAAAGRLRRLHHLSHRRSITTQY